MEQLYVVAGFSQIKSELRIKANIVKPMGELGLWFTLLDDVLYVHDYDQHERCIVIATLNDDNNINRTFIDEPGYSHVLLSYACRIANLNAVRLDQQMNEMYELYGYRPFYF